jgi:SMC interacting uncharacterized protein involved in chromosome segregation
MNSMSRDCKTGEKMLTDTEELYNKLEARANKIDELRKALLDIGVFLSTVEFMLNEAACERDELRSQLEKADIDKNRLDWLDKHYLLCDRVFRFCDSGWLPRHAIDHEMELS